MCMSLYLADERRVIHGFPEFADFIGGGDRIVWATGYADMPDAMKAETSAGPCCLCPVDIPATLSPLGYDVEHDCMDWTAKKEGAHSMTEPKPFPIEDGAFTVPERAPYHEKVEVGFVDGTGSICIARAMMFVIVHRDDIPAFIASLDALTGGGYRRSVLEEAAREVDCGCFNRTAALTAKTKPDRWRACGEASCGALMAQDIRALADKG